jgi:hypothetical protein
VLCEWAPQRVVIDIRCNMCSHHCPLFPVRVVLRVAVTIPAPPPLDKAVKTRCDIVILLPEVLAVDYQYRETRHTLEVSVASNERQVPLQCRRSDQRIHITDQIPGWP